MVIVVKRLVHATFRQEWHIPVVQIVTDREAHYNGMKDDVSESSITVHVNKQRLDMVLLIVISDSSIQSK